MLIKSLGFGFHGEPVTRILLVGSVYTQPDRVPPSLSGENDTGHMFTKCVVGIFLGCLFQMYLYHFFCPQKWLSAAAFLPSEPDSFVATVDGVDFSPKPDQPSSSGSLEFCKDRGSWSTISMAVLQSSASHSCTTVNGGLVKMQILVQSV